MDRIADYSGNLLNHVEALYRPGERALAIELAETLGCAISDTGFKGDGDSTFLAVHPNPDDRNAQNNAFYMSEMRPEQAALEEHLRALGAGDARLAGLLTDYRAVARSKPFGVPHFSIRYADAALLERAALRIETDLIPRLGERLHFRIFRPEDKDGAGGQSIQAFLYQDVIVSGSFLLGQLIELQAHP